MWMDIGWGLYFQVVGTHKHYMSSSKFFLPLVVGALKPSITFVSLPSLPLTPLSLPLAPSHPRLTPLAPSRSPCSPSLLAPTEVVGTPKHSITYPYPTLAIESERGVRGGEREQGEWEEREGARGGRGARGSKRSERERATWWNFHYLIFVIYHSTPKSRKHDDKSK